MSKKRKKNGRRSSPPAATPSDQPDPNRETERGKEPPRETSDSARQDVESRQDENDQESNLDALLPSSNRFSRYFSFVLLVGIVILVGLLFYSVMVQFLVPLFLSAILVVVFRPLHQWMLAKCGNRESVSALLTTIAVMLIVLIPLGAVLMLAAAESRQVVRQFNAAKIEEGFRQVRTKLGLIMPAEIPRIDQELELMLGQTSLTGATEDLHRIALFEVESAAQDLAQEQGLNWPESIESIDPEVEADSEDPWTRFANDVVLLRAQHAQMKWKPVEEEDSANQQRLNEWHDYIERLDRTAAEFATFKTNLLGGKSRTWLTELVNPSREKYDEYVQSATGFLRDSLVTISGKGIAVVLRVLAGAAIMMIGFYFFLLDGPGMLETFKGLSPIDDDHEQELVFEFERVSRAVVIATLLSAAVQGLLAGIGFYVAGLESVFLLAVLSGLLAMVPFVGAASVWVPCSLYLYFVDNNMFAAIGLALYGVAIISMADNIIKPLVLHGQSKLHPLLAFLSVIGGVTALGPIGILIGPMIVAFLQTLLRILRREVTDLGQFDSLPAAPT